ncbi:hypothetical protein COO91_01865 [Nostoc flagelliforme CCNUN1]|uniref:Uncharacterized protein n=1 Tax=Nostoc flagelliforme CCNUN1 TaxID=2038116 RepID=A0A2K8SKL0_9NOSO|nr:hypothetical protein COO91_01865 [Nostoc flagelliforme CCNUN1]
MDLISFLKMKALAEALSRCFLNLENWSKNISTTQPFD